MKKSDLRAKLFIPYKFIKKIIGSPLHLPYTCEGQKASNLIKNKLLCDEPCMICRYGNCELNAIIAYLNIYERKNIAARIFNYFLEDQPIYFTTKTKNMMFNNAGFFPATKEYISEFAKIMIESTRYIDIFATWKPGELRLSKYFPENMQIIPLCDLEPYFHDQPWTKALEGRKVLIIHPFADSIHKQYPKHNNLFRNQNMLPDFDLKVLKAVQSSAGEKTKFKTWFDALNDMCNKIDNIDFDIAIIGAGAYGFPLAAHIKRIGKKAVHLAGATQILFGIKGNRWDRWERYRNLYNEHWIRPSEEEKPKNSNIVENSTYW